MCVDYFNGLIITWEDDRENEKKIFAQRLSSNGVSMWATDGIRICSASSAQSYPNLCSNGTDAMYFIWSDSRDRAYAQKVKIDGEIIGNSEGYLIYNIDYPHKSSDICSSANDTVIVALIENRGSGQDIYAQRFNIEKYIPINGNGMSLELIIIISSVIGVGAVICIAVVILLRRRRRLT